MRFTDSVLSCFVQRHFGSRVSGWKLGRVIWTLDLESEIPGSIPAVSTRWICNTVIPSFNSSTGLVNSQLASPPLAGILKFKLVPYDGQRHWITSNYTIPSLNKVTRITGQRPTNGILNKFIFVPYYEGQYDNC